MKYSIQSGTFPEGLHLGEFGSQAVISGTVNAEDDPSRPLIITPAGDLAVVDTGVDVVIPINWSVASGRAKVNGLTVVRGALPLGLRMTGSIINGKPIRVPSDPTKLEPTPAALRPIWGTHEGEIAVVPERKPYSVSIVADPVKPANAPVTYTVVGSQLPAGAMLNGATGEIFGTAPEVGGYEAEMGTPPVWVTKRGNLGSIDERNYASFSFNAVSVDEYPLTFTIIEGHLPTGLILYEDGFVEGIAPEVTGSYIPDPELFSQRPSFTANSVSFNGNDTLIPVTIPTGRSFSHIEIVSGHLPLGVTLHGRTLKGESTIGTYTFDAVLYDSEQVNSQPTTISVEVI